MILYAYLREFQSVCLLLRPISYPSDDISLRLTRLVFTVERANVNLSVLTKIRHARASVQIVLSTLCVVDIGQIVLPRRCFFFQKI